MTRPDPNAFVALANAIELSHVKPATLDFEVDAGRIYYVKLHPETHAFYYQPQLFLMSTGEGEQEIRACKRVSE